MSSSNIWFETHEFIYLRRTRTWCRWIHLLIFIVVEFIYLMNSSNRCLILITNLDNKRPAIFLPIANLADQDPAILSPIAILLPPTNNYARNKKTSANLQKLPSWRGELEGTINTLRTKGTKSYAWNKTSKNLQKIAELEGRVGGDNKNPIGGHK